MVLVIRKFHPYAYTKELQPSMTMAEENRQTENNKVSSFKEFMKKLDDIKRDEDKDERIKHELIQIPPTEKKKWPQKPCVYCRRKKDRRDTRYIYVLRVMLLSVKIVFLTIMRILKNIFP